MFAWIWLACSTKPAGDRPADEDASNGPALTGAEQTFELQSWKGLPPLQDTALAKEDTGLATQAPPPPASTADTGARQDTGAKQDTGDPVKLDTGSAPQVGPLVARLTADTVEGEYPLVVSFDGSSSDLGSGLVRFEWSFGDGEATEGDATIAHTYIGRGDFEVLLTLFDDATGLSSTAEVTIDVDRPSCPREEDPVLLGFVDDDYQDLSGIAASRLEPDLYWVLEDNHDELRVLDSEGETVSEHDLPNGFEDIEDISVVIDPETGVSLLFIADIGDNDAVRDEIELWIVEEPSPWVDSDLEPLQIELAYPDGSHDAETLLVDPWTLDVFIVTKDAPDEQSVYVKRAPHDDEGPYELEDLGDFSELDLRATGGDVSPDGFRVIVREYSSTARMWFRDGYEPLEEAFDREPCEIEVDDGSRGEGIGFTRDGRGVVSIGEGDDVPLYLIEF